MTELCDLGVLIRMSGQCGGQRMLMRMSGGRGGGGSGRGGDGDVPVTLPIDRSAMHAMTNAIFTMSRGEHVVARKSPSLLERRFQSPTSRSIRIEGKRRKHIYRDHPLVQENPQEVVAALLDPREIVADKDYATRVLFYRKLSATHDIAVVVDMNPQSPLSPRVMTAFAPTKEGTRIRQASEPRIWTMGEE